MPPGFATLYRSAQRRGREGRRGRQRKNNTRKSKIGVRSGVIDREPLSTQFNVGDHSPMNAFNSSLFSLLPFLRVLGVLRGESWFFGMQRFRSPANAVG